MNERNRSVRRQRSAESKSRTEQNDTEDTSPQHSTPLKRRWTSSENLSKTSRNLSQGQGEIDTEEDSSDVKKRRSLRSKERAREKSQENSHEGSSSRRRKRRIKRKRDLDDSRGFSKDDQTEETVSRSSSKYHSEGDTQKSRKKKTSRRGNDEVPITEILKRAHETERTKYEEPQPLPELTTDRIYVQGRNGFSAVKITTYGNSERERNGLRKTRRKSLTIVETQTHPPIRIAIIAQKIWKSVGLVYQGLLGGMALMHFIMIHIFFHTSADFISDYSLFSEIYTNLFTFLITMCIISAFDKFDLARLDMDHIREIYTDNARTVIAVPLYITTLCLHQVSAKTDDQLSLTYYQNLNDTIWSNTTNFEVFLSELKTWQRLTISKDVLAMLAWIFIALGTQDDMLLTHLKSMKKYTSNADSR